ncbi:MAG TPA: hypothetical protein VGS21_12360 [Acidimicrobiales bacterium]|nr:hypothetical protein [Acidimicrobiales bacterium]
MAATDSGSNAPGPSAEKAPDWAAKATQMVDSAVVLVRDKATVPVLRVAEYVVFGVVALLSLVVVILVVPIALIRILDVYLFHWRVWASYASVGGLFALLGLVLLRLRSPKPAVAEVRK